MMNAPRTSRWCRTTASCRMRRTGSKSPAERSTAGRCCEAPHELDLTVEITHHQLPLDPRSRPRGTPSHEQGSPPQSCVFATATDTWASVPATRCTASPTTSATSSGRARWISIVMAPCSPTSVPRRASVADRPRPVGSCGQDPPAAGVAARRRTPQSAPCLRVERRSPADRRDGRCRRAGRQLGFQALKIRFGRPVRCR